MIFRLLKNNASRLESVVKIEFERDDEATEKIGLDCEQLNHYEFNSIILVILLFLDEIIMDARRRYDASSMMRATLSTNMYPGSMQV